MKAIDMLLTYDMNSELEVITAVFIITLFPRKAKVKNKEYKEKQGTVIK